MTETQASGSPVDRIDLFDPATQENWYPAYDTLRAECPVYKAPQMGSYVLTKYEDVQYALRHPEIFANSRGTGSLLKSEVARSYWNEHGWKKLTPLSANPPEHRCYRELIDHFFDAGGAHRARPMATEIVHRLLDKWEGRSTVEFGADFALPLPVEVITRLLGFPVDDIPQLKLWSEAWVMPFRLGLTEEEERFVSQQGVEFQRYIHELAEQRRADPQDDVISHLATTDVVFPGEAPRPLEDWEIINIIDHLYIGGNETTTFALTSAFWLMLQRPDVEARLRADLSLVPEFVEEVLRMESPTQGLFRVTTREVTLSGVTIPEHASVHLRYAAANRDPEMFPDAATFDLDRLNKRRHVAFSAGEHHCPGADLSRMEQAVAVTAILERFPTLRLSDRNDFRHQPGFVLRALTELHLDLG